MNGALNQVINVPIDYAEKEKMMTRMQEDPGLNRQTAIILPRMSFFMDGMTYDSSRKSTTMGKNVFPLPNNTLNWQYKEVPYNFHFSLMIYVKNVEDANKMLEQILPFFTPSYSVKALLIPNRPSVALPIFLETITHSDTDDESFKDRSILIWELHFTLKGYLWGPNQTGGVIETIDVSVYYGTGPDVQQTNNHAFGISNNFVIPASSLVGELDQSISVYPGLYANGQPSNDPANTLPLANIFYNSNYGIISTVNTGISDG